MLFTFLLIVQTIVAAVMIVLILMQRSEGGGLTSSGGGGGLMTARGAADFLTRSTAILAGIFIVLSIILAALAANRGGPREIDQSLVRQGPAPAQGPMQPIPGTTPAAPPIPGAAAPSLPGSTPTTAPATGPVAPAGNAQ